MSGHVDDLSATQETTLTQLRQNLAGLLEDKHDDYMLLQFLRARKFDVHRTEEMFRRHLEFRKEFPEVYHPPNEYQPHEYLLKYFLPPLLGYDKEGCPVRIINVGIQDLKGIVSSFRRPEIRKCVTWFLDQDKADMRRTSKKLGRHIETRTFIFDLDGLSFRQIYHKDVYEMVISFVRLYECNYPENLKVAFVVNTPSFFAWLFNMFKTLLTEDTIGKLKIYGHSGYQEEIVKYIDAEVLPVAYGGTRTDSSGDPRCLTLTNESGPVPQNHYLRNRNRLKEEEEGVRRVAVGRRSKCLVPVHIDVPGLTLEWEVDCIECDIQILVQYTAEGAGAETVVGAMRVTAEQGKEQGRHCAQKAGKYCLVFDNSYSLLRNKVVLYRVFVSSTEKRNGLPANEMQTAGEGTPISCSS